jgi:hypothetical protein
MSTKHWVFSRNSGRKCRKLSFNWFENLFPFFPKIQKLFSKNLF